MYKGVIIKEELLPKIKKVHTEIPKLTSLRKIKCQLTNSLAMIVVKNSTSFSFPQIFPVLPVVFVVAQK